MENGLWSAPKMMTMDIVCENGTPDGVGTMSVHDGELDEQERIEGFVQ